MVSSVCGGVGVDSAAEMSRACSVPDITRELPSLFHMGGCADSKTGVDKRSNGSDDLDERRL